MPATDKMQLTEEKETLFITLYARAEDYRARRSILNDRKASEIFSRVGGDFTKYKGFGNVVTVVRARHFDEWVKEFIAENANAVVLYLGCGLDTRVTRIAPAQASWFDVDYPEVIALRKTFYADTDNYRMIASSITDTSWLAQLPADRPTLIIAEGVLEYLAPGEVKDLLQHLTDYFHHGQVMFDVMNSFAIQSGKEKLKESTGAVHKWAVDDTGEVDKLNPRLERIADISLFESPFMRKLPFGLRLLLSFAALAPQYKNMIRLMRYRF
jgi:O-methyltransferase involved in polyketide biosynthesis